ncbi:MAG: NAD(+) synthase [Rikenellaceae bacterium]
MFGFIKVATAIPEIRVADCEFNLKAILTQVEQVTEKGAQLVVFPELSITGYTCGDLFHQQVLLDGAEDALVSLLHATCHLPIMVIVGMPIATESMLLNCAVVILKGEILGVVPKSHLPEYKEFYEKRWFSPASRHFAKEITLCGQKNIPIGTDLLFAFEKARVAIELCEDLWMPIPPSSNAAMAGANILVNLSASNELIGKHNYLMSLITQQSARCSAAYVYSSAGYGESTTDVVFAGNAIVAENGSVLEKSERFSFEPQLVVADIDVERLETDRRVNNGFTTDRRPEPYRTIQMKLPKLKLSQVERIVPAYPFVPGGLELIERCEEIFNIQSSGLARRVTHTRANTVVVGISGGLDSTLALLVCVKTMDKLKRSRKDIVGVTMPGFGTTGRTYNNAVTLMQELGITVREISIKEACEQHFSDIGHDAEVHDVVYENTQARERTKILMNIANQVNGLVIGTGDLSELALGWATYNGDHMSMYGVNGSIPKTLVKHLVKWVAMHEIKGEAQARLLDIVDTPISPELLPADENGNIAQVTEDLVGPYDLHDFFLYYTLRFGYSPAKIAFLAERAFEGVFDKETINKWIRVFFRRFFNQQFKRSCLPDGPKVGSASLSPRGDWRMPSDASCQLWMLSEGFSQ